MSSVWWWQMLNAVCEMMNGNLSAMWRGERDFEIGSHGPERSLVTLGQPLAIVNVEITQVHVGWKGSLWVGYSPSPSDNII